MGWRAVNEKADDELRFVGVPEKMGRSIGAEMGTSPFIPNTYTLSLKRGLNRLGRIENVPLPPVKDRKAVA